MEGDGGRYHSSGLHTLLGAIWDSSMTRQWATILVNLAYLGRALLAIFNLPLTAYLSPELCNVTLWLRQVHALEQIVRVDPTCM